MADYYTQFSATLVLPQAEADLLYDLLIAAGQLRELWQSYFDDYEDPLASVLKGESKLAEVFELEEGDPEERDPVDNLQSLLDRIQPILPLEMLAEWLQASAGGDGVGSEVHKDSGGLWFHQDESGEPWTLLPLIHRFLKHRELPQVFRMTWAGTCNKMREGGFTGGAGWANRYEWDCQSADAVLEESGPPDAPTPDSPWSFLSKEGQLLLPPQARTELYAATRYVLQDHRMSCPRKWLAYARSKKLALVPKRYCFSEAALYYDPELKVWFLLCWDEPAKLWRSTLCFFAPQTTDAPLDFLAFMKTLHREMHVDGYNPPWRTP